MMRWFLDPVPLTKLNFHYDLPYVFCPVPLDRLSFETCSNLYNIVVLRLGSLWQLEIEGSSNHRDPRNSIGLTGEEVLTAVIGGRTKIPCFWRSVVYRILLNYQWGTVFRPPWRTVYRILLRTGYRVRLRTGYRLPTWAGYHDL